MVVCEDYSIELLHIIGLELSEKARPSVDRARIDQEAVTVTGKKDSLSLADVESDHIQRGKDRGRNKEK
jgi:hypothetical protein